MKVLQVCSTYYSHVGGVPDHVRNISERLAAKGHEVTVFATDPTGKLPTLETIKEVEVRRFKSWAPENAYYFSGSMKSFMHNNVLEYDVVHLHLYHAFPALYAMQARPRGRMVFTPHYHGKGHSLLRNLLHLPFKHFGKKIFEEADVVVCVSEYERNLIKQNFKIGDEKLTLIPNGVDLGELESLNKRAPRNNAVLCVGRLEKYKGVQYLIGALQRVQKNITLEIVGAGPYKNHLVKLARKLGVENRVSFDQNLPRADLLQKYANACMFALLSQYEAYSIVVAEALVAGMPCIVANTSALTEWIDNRNCFGLDFPIQTDALAHLVHKLAGLQNRVDWRSIEGGKILDWSDVVEKLEDVYRSSLF